MTDFELILPGGTAAIRLDFGAFLVVGDDAVRWEALGIAVAVLAGIVWAALAAGRTPAHEDWIGGAAEKEAMVDGPWHLRRDDLLFIVLGAVPGAVVVGRAAYGLVHLGYYAELPGALLDPALGGLSLTGAVVGGTLTGVYVAALLDAPVSRWLHVAIGPVLLAIGLGKAALVLGGSGQGAPSDLPWAVAFVGPGPWGSLDPATPAHPSQLYEAVATMLVLLVVLIVGRLTTLRRDDGRLYAAGIGLWALARAAVAVTWRDPAVLGPLGTEQLLCLGLAAVAFGSLVLSSVLARRRVLLG